MTSRDRTYIRQDRRAVSEVVGYTLLVGIVTVTVIALMVGAMSVQSAIQDQTETESLQQEIQDLDASFGRIAHGDNRTSVRVRTETSNRLSVVREGNVSVIVNDNCSVRRNLSSIRHEKTGETLAYELGGTFRVTEAGVGMVSPPDLAFENGTVDLTITNITGQTASSMTLVKDVDSSMGPAETDNNLFAGTCSQPDNVTVSITSDFTEAWERYAEDEFPVGTVTRSGNTVNVTLNRSHLPEAVEPSRNTVVNFSNSSHYDPVGDDSNITIDKSDDSNVYPVRVVPLYQGMQVTRTAEQEVNVDFYRKGIDVVLVLDESDSMSGSKQEMIDASQLFVGYLNSSIDRVGIVGYNDTSYYHLIDGEYYFSNDFGAVNKTINDTIQIEGDRQINEGLYKMLAINGLSSDATRDQIALLLVGENDSEGPNDDTIERTQDAAENDIVIHTVGVGSDVNEKLLEEVATITDGEYHHASDASKLEEVFSDVAQAITIRKKVVHDPASMKFETGGRTFFPQLPSSPDYVANYSDFPNVNDPTTPANFSLTLRLDDGEPMNLTAQEYECQDWALVGDVKVNQSTLDPYHVTRCAEINTSVDPNNISNINVYTEENTTDDVKDDLGDTRWFQTNLSEVLEPYNESGNLDLRSNEAIVGINYSNGRRMLLLLEIGRSQETNDLTYIVDLTIDDVQVEEKDEQSG